MKLVRWSTMPTKSTGAIVNLHDWNGGVLDNQVFLRVQGHSGWQGRFSRPSNVYVADPSTSPTWSPPTFSQPLHSMTDAVAHNQYISSSTNDVCPPAVVRRTGIYRVVLRGYAQHNLPVPTTASGPSSGDVNLCLLVNSSIGSTVGPFLGPQQEHVVASWPGASSGWDSDHQHCGVVVRHFDAGDIVRIYVGQLSSGGRVWGCEFDLNYLGVST